jgi:hypothetical protein
MSELGKGMAGIGKGMGKMIENVLKGLSRGLAALGKGKVLKGAAAILIIGASLIPFAFALNLMKGVGWGTFFMLGAGLLALTLATAAVGAIMMSGVGAVAILAGAAAFAILAVALIPLAYALSIAAGAFDVFMGALMKLNDIPMGKLFLLGPALLVLGTTVAIVGALSPLILLAALAIGALGVALIPLGIVFKLMGPAIGSMFIFAAGLAAIAGVAAGLFWIAPLIYIGAGALGALGIALLPLAVAIWIAAPAFEKLSVLLATIAIVPIKNLFLIGPALVSMAIGMAALSAGGLMSAVMDGLGSLFGAKSPVDKIIAMGHSAKHINKMADSLKKLPKITKEAMKELNKVSIKPFNTLVDGLWMLKMALDRFSAWDMLKFSLFGGGGIFGKQKAGAGKDKKVAEVQDKGVVKALDNLTKVYEKYNPLKKGFDIGGKTVMPGETLPDGNVSKSPGRLLTYEEKKALGMSERTNADKGVDRWKAWEQKEPGIQTSAEKVQEQLTEAKRVQKMREESSLAGGSAGQRRIRLAKEDVEMWTKIAAHLEVLIEKTEDGNEARETGNIQRQGQINNNGGARPSELPGRGVQSEVE